MKIKTKTISSLLYNRVLYKHSKSLNNLNPTYPVGTASGLTRCTGRKKRAKEYILHPILPVANGSNLPEELYVNIHNL